MALTNIEVKKVDDLTQAEAVDHIPDGSAEQEGNGDQAKSLFFGGFPEEIGQEAEGNDGNHRKKYAAKTRVVFREETEGRTRVSNIGQGEKALNNHFRFV